MWSIPLSTEWLSDSENRRKKRKYLFLEGRNIMKVHSLDQIKRIWKRHSINPEHSQACWFHFFFGNTFQSKDPIPKSLLSAITDRSVGQQSRCYNRSQSQREGWALEKSTGGDYGLELRNSTFSKKWALMTIAGRNPATFYEQGLFKLFQGVRIPTHRKDMRIPTHSCLQNVIVTSWVYFRNCVANTNNTAANPDNS